MKRVLLALTALALMGNSAVAQDRALVGKTIRCAMDDGASTTFYVSSKNRVFYTNSTNRSAINSLIQGFGERTGRTILGQYDGVVLEIGSSERYKNFCHPNCAGAMPSDIANSAAWKGEQLQFTQETSSDFADVRDTFLVSLTGGSASLQVSRRADFTDPDTWEPVKRAFNYDKVFACSVS